MATDLAPDAGATLDDPLEEARRLIGLADRDGLQLRLMGGLAIHARVSGWTAPIARDRRDIDLATRTHDRRAVSELLARNGYEPDRQHNALHGHTQLYFVDRQRGRPVDVLVDRLAMCHRFSFAERLTIDHPTLPLAELLLSKLQIVKINRKDLIDLSVLLLEHELGDDDGTGISVRRILEFTANDWGWWRTASANLERLARFARDDLRPDEVELGRPARFDLATQIATLRRAIDDAPTSLGWKLRARIGDRMTWYDEPEEVAHDVR